MQSSILDWTGLLYQSDLGGISAGGAESQEPEHGSRIGALRQTCVAQPSCKVLTLDTGIWM